jgi:cilia- and flagella-associated protein 57
MSQRKYLEKSVAMLKKNLAKDDEIHKQDNIRIMRENVELIKEINKLRKQIKEIKFS